MHLPKQSKPAVRGTRSRPWRGLDPKQPGILLLEGEDEYEEEAPDDSAEPGESDDSGEY